MCIGFIRLDMGVSENRGCLILGPHNEDPTI